MGRLSLVIVDLDRDYLSKLERFLMVNYPQRFDIFSFSSHGKLSEFLSSPEKRDILLINSILFKRELNLKNIEAVILLKGDGLETVPEGIEAVNKYQHAEVLVTDILRLYAARSRKGATVQGRSITRAACVHSPAGGAGKSSIAAGYSILCARKGLKAFYLNLENIPSTNMFFHGESSQSFSNVIYHLKGKNGSLGLKLEGAKCCDPETGVYFFAPPENVLDMEELTADDISRLITELKASGLYDMVFIDMPSGLNQRNIAIFRTSDAILMIHTAQDKSIVKMKALQNGFEMLERKHGGGLSDKRVNVINLYGRTCFNNELKSCLNDPDIEIPEFTQKAGAGSQSGLVRDVAFLSSLGRLLEITLPQGEEDMHTRVGGGFSE